MRNINEYEFLIRHLNNYILMYAFKGHEFERFEFKWFELDDISCILQVISYYSEPEAKLDKEFEIL